MKKVTLMISLLATAIALNAQEVKRSPELSVVFGLNQPIALNGFNFEVDYWTEKIVIDYSHGFGLEFQDNLITQEARNQKLAFNVTHSLGFGVGYRFTKNFNIRVEPKLHFWEVYYDDAFKTPAGKVTEYTTFTLGLGAYYRWTPFEKKQNGLRGMTIVPSFRWWPNVATSLENGEYEYYNTRTEQTEIHKANNIGISNTSFFVNVSIGYTINLSNKTSRKL